MTEKKLTPMKAIREYCKNQCCAGDTISWKECLSPECPLYPFRMGRNPNRKGIGGNPKISEKTIG